MELGHVISDLQTSPLLSSKGLRDGICSLDLQMMGWKQQVCLTPRLRTGSVSD